MHVFMSSESFNREINKCNRDFNGIMGWWFAICVLVLLSAISKKRLLSPEFIVHCSPLSNIFCKNKHTNYKTNNENCKEMKLHRTLQQLHQELRECLFFSFKSFYSRFLSFLLSAKLCAWCIHCVLSKMLTQLAMMNCCKNVNECCYVRTWYVLHMRIMCYCTTTCIIL